MNSVLGYDPIEKQREQMVEQESTGDSSRLQGDDLATLAEGESQAMLGVSWADAQVKLESGALAGTAAEAELQMLKFLLAS